MTETTNYTELSLDMEGRFQAGCDERFTDAEVAEAGGLEELVIAYRDHHAERIADLHGIADSEVFEVDPERFIVVTKYDE